MKRTVLLEESDFAGSPSRLELLKALKTIPCAIIIHEFMVSLPDEHFHHILFRTATDRHWPEITLAAKFIAKKKLQIHFSDDLAPGAKPFVEWLCVHSGELIESDETETCCRCSGSIHMFQTLCPTWTVD